MIDCYRILDVPFSAGPAEIRAAYLAKMKVLHPDLCPEEGASRVDASDVTFAYWHLRDAARRAAHDRALRQLLLPPPRHQRPHALRPPAPRTRPQQRSHRRNRARLQRLRAAAGVGAFAVAGAAAIICFTYLPGRSGPSAGHAATVERSAVERLSAPPEPRKVEAALAMAAAEEFGSIVRRSGSAGAYQYLRQCLTELATAPSLTILDYCIAFENSAAMWEQTAVGEQRFFAEQQRLARYRSLAESMGGGSTRDALMAEVERLSRAGT